jgi:response regulator RpfG family c-di-GMP phosphodiesterase
MTDKIQILLYILDDNQSDIDQMLRALKSDTFDIYSFKDPNEFTEALNDSVSIVITDIQINKYDVYSTVKAIKDRIRGLYVMVVSGFIDKPILKRLINECHIWCAVEKNDGDWLTQIKENVEMTVPLILDKKMALSDDY